MNKAIKNIENMQTKVETAVCHLLSTKGYSLVRKERLGDSQALLLQWANEDRQHTFQLLWDRREQWFLLEEFHRTNNLHYMEATEIDIFPYTARGLFFRTSYDAKYIRKIEKKMSTVESLRV
jgi:hypothetical protein